MKTLCLLNHLPVTPFCTDSLSQALTRQKQGLQAEQRRGLLPLQGPRSAQGSGISGPHRPSKRHDQLWWGRVSRPLPLADALRAGSTAGHVRARAECAMTEGSTGPGQVVREGFPEEVPLELSPTQSVSTSGSALSRPPALVCGEGPGTAAAQGGWESVTSLGGPAPTPAPRPALHAVSTQSQPRAWRVLLPASAGSHPSALEGQCLGDPQEPGQTGRLSPDLSVPDPTRELPAPGRTLAGGPCGAAPGARGGGARAPRALTRDCWCRSGPGRSRQGETAGGTRSWPSTRRRGRARIRSRWEEGDMSVRRQAWGRGAGSSHTAPVLERDAGGGPTAHPRWEGVPRGCWELAGEH